MALDWNDYPSSGRTQYFGGERSSLPGGVGYAYRTWTTNATGIYTQYNSPFVVVAYGNPFATDITWRSPQIPPGFTDYTYLARKLPPVNLDLEFTLSGSTGDDASSFTTTRIQTHPNLRSRFTLPIAKSFLGNPITGLPDAWTIEPLTLEQWMVQYGP